MIDIEKLLAGRQAVEYYREHQGRADATEHERLVQELISKLKALGFKSIDAFFEQNKNLVEQDIIACNRFEGECDGCPDREPGCKTLSASCCAFRQKNKIDKLFIYKDIPPIHQQKLWEETYPSKLAEALAGAKIALFPNCKITVQRVKEPTLDWYW
jgi:hypothetical protein